MTFEFDLTVTLSLIFSVATLIFAWLRTRRKDVEDSLARADARLGQHDARISSLEQTVRSLPGKDDMHALHLGMAEMRGDLREMRAAMEGNTRIMGRLENIVTRHEEHLLDGAKR